MASPSPKRSATPRSGSSLLRWLRFGFYAALAAAILARNADPILQALRLVASPLYWATWTPCLPCALGLLALCSAYLAWLTGATVAGWRMPLVVHLVPIALLVYTVLSGPLARRSDGFATQGPADRAVAAMRALDTYLASQAKPPCSIPGQQYEAALAGREGLAPPGYRSFGRPVRFQVVVEEGSQPRRIPGRPAELYLVCSSERYWISAVTTDSVPLGRPAMVRDGVGRVAVVTGRIPP